MGEIKSRYGHGSDIKLFHKVSERIDKSFSEQGVRPFVISHRWDKLLGDLFIYTV